jgi:hypothetical protein
MAPARVAAPVIVGESRRPGSGRALLVEPLTLGREIKLVLNFDEVIRRKLAEGKE